MIIIHIIFGDLKDYTGKTLVVRFFLDRPHPFNQEVCLSLYDLLCSSLFSSRGHCKQSKLLYFTGNWSISLRLKTSTIYNFSEISTGTLAR